MKRIFKTLFSALLLAFCMSSCANATEQEIQEYANDSFREIEYKGHSYIMFRSTEGYSGYAGLEHNPDCPCHKKGGQNDNPHHK